LTGRDIINNLRASLNKQAEVVHAKDELIVELETTLKTTQRKVSDLESVLNTEQSGMRGLLENAEIELQEAKRFAMAQEDLFTDQVRDLRELLKAKTEECEQLEANPSRKDTRKDQKKLVSEVLGLKNQVATLTRDLAAAKADAKSVAAQHKFEVAEHRSLVKKHIKLTNEMKQLQGRHDEVVNQHKSLTDRHERARSRRGSTGEDEDVDPATGAALTVAQLLKAKRVELASLKRTHQSTLMALQDVTLQLESKQEDYTTLKSNQNVLRGEHNAMCTEYKEVKAKYEALAREMDDHSASPRKSQASLALNTLTLERDSLMRKVERANVEQEQLSTRHAAAVAELTERAAKFDELQGKYDELSIAHELLTVQNQSLVDHSDDLAAQHDHLTSKQDVLAQQLETLASSHHSFVEGTLAEQGEMEPLALAKEDLARLHKELDESKLATFHLSQKLTHQLEAMHHKHDLHLAELEHQTAEKCAALNRKIRSLEEKIEEETKKYETEACEHKTLIGKYDELIIVK
jgi:chromosome segregation ATPase